MKKGILAAVAVLGLGMASYANTALDPNFVTGFSSDYTFVATPDQGGPGGSWVYSTYAIDTNPNNDHALWYSFTAPNGGDMLIANGAIDPGARVWYETIGPGTYDFSALVANNYPLSPACLVLELNGTIVSSPFSAPNPPGTWAKWDACFTANSTEVLSIVDLNTQWNGNDFALAAVPEGGLTSAMLGAALLGLGWARRKFKK